MRRMILVTVVLLAAVPLAAQEVSTKMVMIAPLTPTRQALAADVVVVGKVTDLDEAKVEATQYAAPNAAKVEYTVANVKIAESVMGARGLTTVRVGFIASAPAPVQPPAGVPMIRPGRGFRPVNLTVDQEGLFCLVKHHEGDFYILQANSIPLDKKAADFDAQLDKVRLVAKTLRDPQTALKADDKEARLRSAALLLQKYNTIRPTPDGKPQTRIDLPAEESKLLMKALAEMPWTAEFRDGDVPPAQQSLFHTLGVADGQHGFAMPKFPVIAPNTPPEQVQAAQQEFQKQYQEAVAGWIKANAEAFRVQRYAAK